MMRSKRGILVCETLVREVTAAITMEGFDDVQVEVFPHICDCPAGQHPQLNDIVRDVTARFESIILLTGSCRLANPLAGGEVGTCNVTCLESCFHLFLPHRLIRHYQSQGAYLLTPGWLESWEERLPDRQFDQAGGQAFFAESCSRLMLLDTGVSPESAEQLAAMAAFVDRPYDVVPVGLEMLRCKLAQHLQPLPAPPATTASPLTAQLADYALVFDMMSRLEVLKTEEKVIRAIVELFGTLCAPELLIYLPYRKGEAGTPFSVPAGASLPAEVQERLLDLQDPFALQETETGFYARLKWENELLGAFLVEGFAVPQQKNHYLNLTFAILPVLALAVFNARGN
ncbi:MAG: DUF1638 domain-containing protein [Armatimonadota bacterium]